MAIYCHTRRCLPVMFIFSKCNVTQVIQKYKVKGIQSVRYQFRPILEIQRYSHSSSKKSKDGKRKSDRHDGTTETSTMFNEKIAQEKERAQRSVLMHISYNDYDAMLNYCMRTGTVNKVWPFYAEREKPAVLVEFSSRGAVNEILNQAVNFTTVPIRTPEVRFVKKKDGSVELKCEETPPPTYVAISNPLQVHQVRNTLMSAPTVSGQIRALYELLKLSPIEERLRYFVLYQLENALVATYPNIIAVPFGSSVNGCGRRCSDLDLVIQYKSKLAHKDPHERDYVTFYSFSSKNLLDTKQFLEMLSFTLPAFVPSIRNMQRILAARVPILKFFHEPTNVRCDLSYAQESGIYMAELIYLWGEYDPRLRPLIMLVREWAKSREVTRNNPGRQLTNFNISLLVIFYFQVRKILPSLEKLRTYATAKDLSEHDKCYGYLRRLELLPRFSKTDVRDTLEDLLYGFFEYYSKFTFSQMAVCVTTGRPQANTLSAPIFIRNPFDTNVNVTRNVSIDELRKFKLQIDDALFVLTNYGHSPSETLSVLLTIETVKKSAATPQTM